MEHKGKILYQINGAGLMYVTEETYTKEQFEHIFPNLTFVDFVHEG